MRLFGTGFPELPLGMPPALSPAVIFGLREEQDVLM